VRSGSIGSVGGERDDAGDLHGVAKAEGSRSVAGAGLSGATPVAAVANATLAEQRIGTGTLAGMEQMIQREGIESPAILVIGEVARRRWSNSCDARSAVGRVAARPTLAWPLAGEVRVSLKRLSPRFGLVERVGFE